jgi:3-methyladenine DNA glycosylase AlkD
MPQTTSPEIKSLVTAISKELRALPQLKADPIRGVRRGFSKRLADRPPRFMINLALALIARPNLVYRIVAYELIHHHRPALRSLKAATLERLGIGIDSWGAVDTFAGYIAGPAWCNGQITDAQIHRWARSKDRWWRRAALVSTVPLNLKSRGGCGDCKKTLAVCGMLIDDRDDMVVKAMSWALRELSKRNPKAVRGFIAENKDALAARVLREVRNKLTTGVKNPRR